MNIAKSSLSGPRRRLIELLQDLNFGRIENLHVGSAEPLFEPAPRIVRERKFGAVDGPRPERFNRDFTLKAQVVELLNALDHLKNGVVTLIEVKNGLPFRMEIVDSAD